MKTFILPIMVLALIIYASTTQLSTNLERYQSGNEKLEAKVKEIAEKTNEKLIKKRVLENLKSTSSLKEEMLATWSDLPDASNINVNRKIDNLINKYSCVPSNSSNNKMSLDFGGMVVPAQVFQTTVIGDFKSILRVLGSIEEEYPSCLITEVAISESLTGVSCKISIAIPYLNEITENA